MQEKQVTLGDQTLKLTEPFLVLATQNPIEQEGTYPLPEAQLDRFMLKVRVGYPSKEDEVKIVDRMAGSGAEPTASKVMTCDDILASREVVRQIFVDDKVKRYAVDLVSATRDPKASDLPQLAPLIDNGASVRASIALIKVAKAQALLSGRDFTSASHNQRRSRTTCCTATVSSSATRRRLQGRTSWVSRQAGQILENIPGFPEPACERSEAK